MHRIFPALALALLLAPDTWAQETPPRSHDPRIKIELFAENPQIVTPTGLDVDTHGRVWAIESNTHFPPEGYRGHPSDRILVMSDTDNDGKADRITPFADGLKFTMSIAVVKPWQQISPPSEGGAGGVAPQKKTETTPPDPIPKSSAYVATRAEIFLLHDDDGDDGADRKLSIVRLDTTGNYPHNGLAGFAFDALGWMFFGFGENLGADYKVIGSDGTTLSGGGEGGNIYRCRLDGSKLERWATGFWNPHASCFDAFGRLFTVDNDPDSRPPCRLLHIIPGGDYGYRFRNGRKGLHPFTSWNGEIPGTLPMVAGTGEAPSGIVAYESDGLPDEYLGNLLVTSWGDHRIDRFRLKQKDFQLTSLAEPFISGGENFRPVGIALAPDGSLYCTDWVLKDYKLHGRGRVWRISSTAANDSKPIDVSHLSERSTDDLRSLLSSKSLDVRRAAANSMAKRTFGAVTLASLISQGDESVRSRIESLWAVISIPSDGSFTLRGIELLQQVLASPNQDEVLATAVWNASEPRLDLDDETIWLCVIQTNSRRKQEPNKPQKDYLTQDAAIALFARTMVDEMIFTPGSSASDQLVKSNAISPVFDSIFVNQFARIGSETKFSKWLEHPKANSPAMRNIILLAARRQNPKDSNLLSLFLSDSEGVVRRLAVQWVGEERLNEFRPQVEAILRDPQITADLFLATLAALQMLDGVPPGEFDKTPPEKYVLPLVKDEKTPAPVRARALSLVDPNDPALTDDLLISLLKSDDAGLKLETIRTTQTVARRRVSETIREIAKDATLDVNLRAEAIVALAATVHGRVPDDISLTQLRQNVDMSDSEPALRIEKIRALRGHTDNRLVERSLRAKASGVVRPFRNEVTPEVQRELADQFAFALVGAKIDLPIPTVPLQSKRPDSRAEWNDVLKEPGDAAAGRRTFFHVNSAGCYKCHTVNGRGGRVGPDLSTVGRALSREKLVDSILEPSKEIAPQFVTWAMETKSGKVHTGMVVRENEGKTVVGDAEGKTVELKTADIAERVPQQTSIMPDKLADRLTPQEFRDLLAFLESLR